MASIRKEISIDAPAEHVWSAVRDVGKIHERLARGFVTDVRLEAGARVVTFANGLVVRERLVDVDDGSRRVAYAVVGGAVSHHHASMQVFEDGPGKSRLLWITDLLPDEAAGSFQTMIDQGSIVMKQTLEATLRAHAS
jgi:carbon monoxide dehydrogenase subunit G